MTIKRMAKRFVRKMNGDLSSKHLKEYIKNAGWGIYPYQEPESQELAQHLDVLQNFRKLYMSF